MIVLSSANAAVTSVVLSRATSKWEGTSCLPVMDGDNVNGTLTVVVTGTAVTGTKFVTTPLQVEVVLWPSQSRSASPFKLVLQSSAQKTLFHHTYHLHLGEGSKSHLLRTDNSDHKAQESSEFRKIHDGESYFSTMSNWIEN